MEKNIYIVIYIYKIEKKMMSVTFMFLNTLEI